MGATCNELAKAYLEKARQSAPRSACGRAHMLVRSRWPGRLSAAYHAAQAFILATNKVAKTHSGVRSEFARLARNDPGLEPSSLSDLTV